MSGSVSVESPQLNFIKLYPVPLIEKFTQEPEHALCVADEIKNEDKVPTLTVQIACDWQVPSDPVKVYWVVVVGFTTTWLPVSIPGIHEYETVPPAVRVAWFVQKFMFVPVVITGLSLMVRGTKAELVQPATELPDKV